MSKLIVAAAAAAALVLAGCSEPSQEPARYAGKEDAKPYAGDAFKGDKAKWEAALAARASTQNDYAPFREAGLKKP